MLSRMASAEPNGVAVANTAGHAKVQQPPPENRIGWDALSFCNLSTPECRLSFSRGGAGCRAFEKQAIVP